MVNNNYDYIVTVFYDVWKNLKGEQKVISLDKILCAIDMGTMENPVPKKKGPDCKEYLENMNYYTPRKVMETSEMIHLACSQIAEEAKEAKKAKKENKNKKSITTL